TAGIRLQCNIAAYIPDLILVVRSLPYPRNKDFPDARGPENAQRVNASIPIIEIANHADALGIRRPDRETGPRNSINYPQLRAEFVINTQFVPLPKQIHIHLAEGRQKGKSIPELPGAAVTEV